MNSTVNPVSRSSTRRLLAALAVVPIIGIVPLANAANSTWNVNSSGNFTLGTNWTAGVPGSDTGTTSTDVATFNRSLINASRVITLDSNRNLAGITFNNDAATGSTIYQIGGATFGATSAGTLTLTPNAVIQNSGTGAATGGSNGIDVNMILTGNTSVTNTYANSVFNFGVSSGLGNNTINTATNLGNVDLILGGTSTGSNLLATRLNQATGTTLRLVKEGTGFWQINGLDPNGTLTAPRTQGMTGGLLIRQGGVSIGRSSAQSIGAGPLIVGDSNTTAIGDLRISTGSSVNVSNAVTVANSLAPTVIFERGGGSGGGTFSGNISLNRDILVRQATTATQTLAFTTGTISGTGNITVNTAVASAGAVNFSGGVNMTGKFTNQSTTGTGLVTISGPIGSNVTEVVQNSVTSAMAISNGNSTFGATTVSAGTLSVTGSGRLGAGDITVASGATLTLGNNASIQDSSAMFFGSTSLINLNFSGADTLSMLAINALSPIYINPGTYTASQLNTFFGGSVFAGTGSLNVLSAAIPEPSSFAWLAGLGILGFAAARRRARS